MVCLPRLTDTASPTENTGNGTDLCHSCMLMHAHTHISAVAVPNRNSGIHYLSHSVYSPPNLYHISMHNLLPVPPSAFYFTFVTAIYIDTFSSSYFSFITNQVYLLLDISLSLTASLTFVNLWILTKFVSVYNIAFTVIRSLKATADQEPNWIQLELGKRFK